MRRICVYCGSSSGSNPLFREAATKLGRLLVERDIGLVYGGGGAGLMGAVADAVLEAGGEVIGVIPKLLVEREHEHRGLTQLFEVESMHERKQKMADLSDAFIALPGGIGTLEEIIEVFTWLQLGYHGKPVAVLNVDGFYDPLLKLLKEMVSKGFLAADTLGRLIVGNECHELCDAVDDNLSIL